jgi:hypothetical protein
MITELFKPPLEDKNYVSRGLFFFLLLGFYHDIKI